jgi:hypothetical protein
MAEIKTGVLLSLKDLFSQGINKAAGAATGFAGKTLGAIDKVDSAISGTTAKLAALGLTLSVGAAAKGIIEMDHRMTRLGISANASAEQITKLKRAVFDVAQASDVKVDPAHILGGLEVIIGKTNDLKYAEDNIRNIGLAIQATGESGDSIGALFSEFHNFQYSSEQISVLMDDMVAQANEGAFSLADFAKAAPQLFSTLNAIGFGTAPENIKKTNAALQIINAGTKSPEKAIASFNAAMNELTDPEKQRDLRCLGISIRDSAGNLRDFNDIMLEIAQKSENTRNADYLNRIFSASSMQAIRSYVTHGERMYTNLTDLGDTTGLLQKQSAEMANTLQSNIRNLQTAFNAFADSNLSKPLSDLTELLNKLAENPERIKRVFTGIAVGIGAIAAIKGIAGISRLIGSLSQLKSGNVNITESLSMASAMPVYVTNWNSGGGVPGMGSGGQFQQPLLGQGNPIAAAQNADNFAYGAKKAGAIMVAYTAVTQAAKAYQEVKAIDANEEMTEREKSKAKGGAVGSAVGTTVGTVGGVLAGGIVAAKVGAMIGTAIAPGVGTAIGGAIGLLGGSLVGWLGGRAGRAIGEEIGEALADDGSETSRVPNNNRRYGRAAQRRMRVSDLPPEITQTGSNIAPLRAELDGQAVMDVNVNLSGVSPTASVAIRENPSWIRFNPGSAVQYRRSGL